MIRFNLLRAHGTNCCYGRGCRCAMCRAEHTRVHRLWIAAHPRYNADKLRRRYRANPEEGAARMRAWYAAHPGYSADACRRQHEAYPEKRAEHHRRYRQSHPAECAAASRARKARKRNANGTHSGADVQAQYQRQRGKCFWCKAKVGEKYHADHVTPLALGGGNGPENIVVACPTCNMSKHATHPMDFAGVMV